MRKSKYRLVTTKGAAPALLALALSPVMRTNGAALALLAPAPQSFMRTNGAAPALLALALLSFMRTMRRFFFNKQKDKEVDNTDRVRFIGACN